VTTEFLDLLGVCTCRDRERHCRVPKAVRRKWRELGRADGWNRFSFVLSPDENSWVYW
jgi:hypothetical protein